MPGTIMSCFSSANGTTFNMAGSGHALNISNWSGDLTIANKTGTDACNIHFSAASITIAASVTNGTGIHLDGVGEYINLSSVTPTHVSILSAPDIAERVWTDSRALTQSKFIGLK